MKKAIVVGAGIAGLACSLRLVKKGYQVTVLEKNAYVGGKINALEQKGYRFDLGPSLFTLPELLTELFELHQEKAENYFKYKKLEVICHYFWPDGSQFKAPAAIEKWVKEAASFFNEPQENLKKYLAQSALKYKITAPLFLEKSLHDFKSYFQWNTLKGILNIRKLHLFTTLAIHNKKAFKSKKLQQYFNRFATYNGSSPYKTAAIMSMIPHLEMQKGTFFPVKGMHDIGQSLYQLAKDKGVHFVLNATVKEILTKGNTAYGVKYKNQNTHVVTVLDAHCIISNADVYNTYKNLLPQLKTPRRVITQERSTSGLIFYWGIKKTFPVLSLHNIFFSEHYQKEFEELFKQKTLPTDPTIYLNISAKEKPSDAPNGCENWFVMINAPAHEGQPWETLIKTAKATIIKKLSHLLHTDIAPLIETEYLLDPLQIAQQTSSYKGALYGTSSNSNTAAFLRQSNKSSQLKNLYFAGGSAHPGGGIPLCLQSAKITTQLIPNACL